MAWSKSFADYKHRYKFYKYLSAERGENSSELKIVKKILKLNFIIREYGSTLYVGLARAISSTNTNFRLTFLITRLQEALYEDLAV